MFKKIFVYCFITIVGVFYCSFVFADNNDDNIIKLTEALKLIDKYYIKEVDYNKFVSATLDKFLTSLDDYSEYLPKDEYKKIRDDSKGVYGGIGVVLTRIKSDFIVLSVIENSPAFKAGIRVGDEIIAVDDENVVGSNLELLIKKIRGKLHTKVKLRIKKNDGVETDIVLLRKYIDIITVKDVFVLNKDTAYFKVLNFKENTALEMERALGKLSKECSLKNLIIDFRNNPGGVLSAAIDVAELFLDKNEKIVTVSGKTKQSRIIFKAKKNSKYGNIKIIILVNRWSASASEIVAGALRDNAKAYIVGEPTFGKSLVQSVFELPDKSAIKITTAEYFTPKGLCLSGKGIVPDMDIKYINDYSKKDILTDYSFIIDIDERKNIILADSIVKGALMYLMEKEN